MDHSEHAVLRTPSDERAIALTAQESAVVIELGLRPTYSIVPSANPEGDATLMIDNAARWMQAGEITSAGRSRRLPRVLWREVATLLEEALAEAVRDLGDLILEHELWLDGAVDHGFAGLDDDATDRRYEDYIGRERRHLSALWALSFKLGERLEIEAA
jgi:hypothetical protein